jgi:hypothetical protein
LRVEHKTKVPLSAENVVDMLQGHVNMVDLNVRLSRQDEALRRLIGVTEKNTALVYQMIDRRK